MWGALFLLNSIHFMKKKFKGKKALIIGGLGLIGSSTAHRISELGGGVTIVDNKMPQYGANNFNIRNMKHECRLIIGDIRNAQFTKKIVSNKDIIFNFAAQVSHNESIVNPILDNEINCIGHLNLLLACKEKNRKAILINSGSRLQYGSINHLPVDEDHPRNPLSIYAIHKNTAEQYYYAFYKQYGIRSICFRITNPYGPRSQMKNAGYSIINWFIRQAMENKTITVFGKGTQVRDYIYIDDLVNGMLEAIVKQKYGQIFNLGSGVPTPFIDMAKIVVRIVGSGKIKQIPWPKNYENFETGDFYTNISKITMETGWKPNINLEDGIRKTYEFYKNYRKYYW